MLREENFWYYCCLVVLLLINMQENRNVDADEKSFVWALRLWRKGIWLWNDAWMKVCGNFKWYQNQIKTENGNLNKGECYIQAQMSFLRKMF